MTALARERPPAMRIMVTGAAGLIGRAACAELAGRGHAVMALLHHNRAPVPNATPVYGDVAAPGFGLPPEATGRLTGMLDLIVHCAAVTAFNLDAAQYDLVNTAGVARVLGVACTGGRRIPLLHLSTAYVCGERDGVIAEAPADTPSFVNGYEASKAAGETLVLAAHRRGHPVAIARPSIVVGASGDGATGAFGSLYQLIRLVTEGRVSTLPATADASLDLVPIDHVAGALADIAERMPAADGRIFHLASGTPVTLAALGLLARRFPHLHAPRFVPPELFNPARLTARERQLHAQVVQVYSRYLRRSPAFVTDNLAGLSGRVCPPTDAAFLRRLVGYAIAAGFLRDAAVQRTSG